VGTEGNGELGGSPQAGDERGRGRYLWVAVELRGDGLRSPVLHSPPSLVQLSLGLLSLPLNLT
jgi:hypothetical protein